MGWLNEEETCTQSKRFLAFKFSLVAFICFFLITIEIQPALAIAEA